MGQLVAQYLLGVNPPLLWSMEPLQVWNRVAASCRYLQGFFLSVFTQPSCCFPLCLSSDKNRSERSCLSAILHSWGNSR